MRERARVGGLEGGGRGGGYQVCDKSSEESAKFFCVVGKTIRTRISASILCEQHCELHSFSIASHVYLSRILFRSNHEKLEICSFQLHMRETR